MECPVLDLQMLKRCLQNCTSVVIGNMDPFSVTEFIVVRVKCAEHRDWMTPQHALRRAVVLGDLSMAYLVEVVANIVGKLPLIVSDLKAAGCKTYGDSLVV